MTRRLLFAVALATLYQPAFAQDVKLPAGPLEVRVKELLLIDVDGATAEISGRGGKLVYNPNAAGGVHVSAGGHSGAGGGGASLYGRGSAGAGRATGTSCR